MRYTSAGSVGLLSTWLVLGAPGLSAQLIPIRTVPVASGDQFLTLPSESLGMGGVRLAVDDELGDPWSNPAKGARLAESAFLGAPTFYLISDRGGAGRTFPLGGIFTSARWFGGGALALQQIENNPPQNFFWARPQPLSLVWAPERRLSDAFARNLYGSSFVGVRLGAAWSLGLGLSAATLDALDGVDLLYANAERIEQSGSTQDVRLGLHHTGERDNLALLLLHSRISMEHEVTSTVWATTDPLVGPVPETHVELNEDKTRTWGAQIEWDRSLSAPGWRLGAAGTVNRKSHPKIPNYDIQNIPRDPGTTWAYELAVGFAREAGPATFAVDVAVQPIWSETWQEANADDVTASGGALEVGDRSIENDFFFTNVILRTGLAYELGRATLQGGLEVRSYDYALEQVNHVVNEFRDQDESWMEWSPSIGAGFRFAELEVRYAGRLTTGTGRPGTDRLARLGLDATNQASSPDFIVAPEGPLTLQQVRVVTHQLSVVVPVR